MWCEHSTLARLGFIPKSAQRVVMVGALELVLSGGIYIPPEILVRGALALYELCSESKLPSTGWGSRPPIVG